MKDKGILSILKNSLYLYFKNLHLALPLIALLIVLYLFAYLSVKVNYSLQSNLTISLWLVFFSIISLLIISFFLSGLVGMSKSVLENKKRASMFFASASKYFLKNFLIILLFLAAYNGIRLVAYYLAFFIGNLFYLSVDYAVAINYVVYVLGALIAIFLSFTTFYLIIENASIKQSLIKSIDLAQKNYLSLLAIYVVLFISKILFNYIPIPLAAVIINAVFLMPYLCLILTSMVLSKSR